MTDIHRSFLEPFFVEMNKVFPNDWCVLHSFETLPYYSASDVDMAFSSHDIEGLQKLIHDVGRKAGWTVCQKLWYDEKYCFYYVLNLDHSDIFLAIDFLIDNEGIGVYGFKSSILTKDSIFFKDTIKVPNHETAFCYKVIKRIYKQRSFEEDEPYLREHFDQSDKKKILKILIDQFGSEGADYILHLFEKDNLEFQAEDIDFLTEKKNKYFFDSKRRFQKKVWYTLRRVNRTIYPTGMILVAPKMDEKKMEVFHKNLTDKVDILFRKVFLNRTNSMVKNTIGLLSSTLVIVPVKKGNFPHVLKIQPGSKRLFVTLPNHFAEIQDMNDLVNSSFDLIMGVLKDRKIYKKTFR